MVAVKRFVDRYYKSQLTRESATGISTTLTLLGDILDDSALEYILEYLRNHAKSLPVMRTLDDAVATDSDGTDCEPEVEVYRPSIIEPPALSCQKGTVFKFNPPLYNPKSMDWNTFMEHKYLGWARQRGLCPYDKAVGLFYTLKEERLQQNFLKCNYCNIS